MQSTGLVYFEDSYKIESCARVLSVEQIQDKGIAVVLDQTIFYPQGGGQPADYGQISSSNARFDVNDVRLVDGIVHHFGIFSNGNFAPDEEVSLQIDRDRRLLHARLHSAGHLIDAAVQLLELPLIPTKGYHFPDSPYVEYEGELPAGERDDIRLRLEQKVNELVENKLETQIDYVDKAQLQELCGFVPNYIVSDKNIRVITLVPKRGCPCGGTHVKNSNDIGHLVLTKIKVKSGQCRVSYTLA